MAPPPPQSIHQSTKHWDIPGFKSVVHFEPDTCLLHTVKPKLDSYFPPTCVFFHILFFLWCCASEYCVHADARQRVARGSSEKARDSRTFFARFIVMIVMKQAARAFARPRERPLTPSSEKVAPECEEKRGTWTRLNEHRRNFSSVFSISASCAPMTFSCQERGHALRRSVLFRRRASKRVQMVFSLKRGDERLAPFSAVFSTSPYSTVQKAAETSFQVSVVSFAHQHVKDPAQHGGSHRPT